MITALIQNDGECDKLSRIDLDDARSAVNPENQHCNRRVSSLTAVRVSNNYTL